MTKGTIGKGVVKGLMAMKTSQDTGLYCKTSESLCSTESIDEPKTSSVAGSGTPSTLSGPPSIPYRGGLQMNKPYLKSATDFHPKKSSEPKKK